MRVVTLWWIGCPQAYDVRMDGDFDVTVEKLLHARFPDVDKFRPVHQLDHGA